MVGSPLPIDQPARHEKYRQFPKPITAPQSRVHSSWTNTDDNVARKSKIDFVEKALTKIQIKNQQKVYRLIEDIWETSSNYFSVYPHLTMVKSSCLSLVSKSTFWGTSWITLINSRVIDFYHILSNHVYSSCSLIFLGGFCNMYADFDAIKILSIFLVKIWIYGPNRRNSWPSN